MVRLSVGEKGRIMADGDFKRFEAEFLALARRIFDAGAKAERDRVLGLIQFAEAPVTISANRPSRKNVAKGYGSVSAPVREALIQLAPEAPDGVGPRQLAEYFARFGGGPDERQVRAALKTLTISGEAIRASRGRYLPRLAVTPGQSEEKPGGDTPGFFDPLESMAAE
jgi:hypothetical protein